MHETSPTQPLWEPSQEVLDTVEMARYMRWAGERRGAPFGGYGELWRWSVDELEDFWASIWEFCGVRASKPYERVLGSRSMPGASWFEGAELNYAENLLQGREDAAIAVIHASEARAGGELTWGQLRGQVAAAAAGLRALGVERGTRVRCAKRDRPLRPDRAAGAALRRRLPPRRQGLRSPRGRGRDPRRAANSRARRRARLSASRRGRYPGTRRGARERQLSGREARATQLAAAARLSFRREGAGRARGRLAAGRIRDRPRLRAGALCASPVGALLLGHYRPAEGDRAGPRRHPARAAQEAPASGPATWRSHVLVYDHRLDDVELPDRLPAQRGGDRALRRQPRIPGPRRVVAAGRAQGHHVHGRERRPAREHREGGRRARSRPRPEPSARDRLDRLAAGA